MRVIIQRDQGKIIGVWPAPEGDAPIAPIMGEEFLVRWHDDMSATITHLPSQSSTTLGSGECVVTDILGF